MVILQKRLHLIFSIILFIGFFYGCTTNKNHLTRDALASGKSCDKKKNDNILIQNISDIPLIVKKESEVQLTFKEVWAYVVDGHEKEFEAAKNSITDVGYFGATLDTFGNLVGVPERKKLVCNEARVHMVIVDTGKALTHFCISSDYSVRKKLLADIVANAEKFDGVQIDFELVSPSDKEDYLSFLKELKTRLPKKIISVAIPARTKTLEKDAYDYKNLSKIVDRIVVMAYDEHWATSRPGPVASIKWCKNIMNYSKTVIPAEKLIMGLPFYGRCWNTDNTAGAYRFTGICKVQKEQKIKKIKRINDIPSFQVKKNVTYQFYYDDLYSLTKRLNMYYDNGVQNISFWRLGQEDVAIWNYVVLDEKE
ncbi:MAG: glycosyl hydrolase family 18 protein [Treponemataceae bacterium]